MADAATTTTSPLASGSGTSEFRVTMIATILSALVTIIGIASNFLDVVQQAGVTGRWVTIATTVVGVIGTVLSALGYTVTRGNVKAAAVAASRGAPVVPADQAAADVFKAP